LKYCFEFGPIFRKNGISKFKFQVNR